MKRTLDVALASVGLVIGSMVLVPAMFAIWLEDRHSPLYLSTRAGRGGAPFRMVKLRSMRHGADRSGVLSTAGDDPRITRVGRWVRRLKLDELVQLWNVLAGDMSLVGPRPQVLPEVARYTEQERELLSVRPGLTDLASIVFADEGAVLQGSDHPDRTYDQVIRPWKSRLGLLYLQRGMSTRTDLYLLYLTLLNAASRRRALAGVSRLVRQLDGGAVLVSVARRTEPLTAALPPGA
ncbi:MAG: sugar transferase [Gemmatimonadales bacterium]